MKIVSDPADIVPSWRQIYERLAEMVASTLPLRGEIVEVGCGKGQFTVPFLKTLPGCRIIAVDRLTGPYHGNRSDLAIVIRRNGLRARVRVVKADYLDWMRSQVHS